MIAVDTNILIYAHRRDSSWHDPASRVLRSLAENRARWAIPWPCLHEFFSVATHPRIYSPPSPADAALDQVAVWLESPSLVLLGETEGHWSAIRALVERGRLVGPTIHDARIAALCQTHGVRELWTSDRDFSRFPTLHVKNPLVES